VFGFVQSQDFQHEELGVSKDIGLAFHDLDLGICAFERTGGNAAIIPLSKRAEVETILGPSHSQERIEMGSEVDFLEIWRGEKGGIVVFFLAGGNREDNLIVSARFYPALR
jgi:hypothetical protein